MKLFRLYAGILAAAMTGTFAVSASAAEETVNLYTGAAEAAPWYAAVTVVNPDRTLFTPEICVRVTCDSAEAPYFVLSSDSGGETWASTAPTDRRGNEYFYSYEAMTASFGDDFSLLNSVSVMAANAPATVYAIDILPAAAADPPPAGEQKIRVVGYLPDWSYRAYHTLDFSALTHLNIAFCNPDSDGRLFCYIPDSAMHEIVETAHENGVRVMAALGGGGGCDGYLQHLDTPEKMTAFSENIMAYCDTYDLDGIDLDIELKSSHAIWDVYADWVTMLRTLCDERELLLSTATAQWVAVRVSEETFARFDFLNVMAYDNDGSAVSHADFAYAEKCLRYFRIQRGIPAEKLVLGVPFYGRGYTADGALDWDSGVAFADLVARDPANYLSDTADGIAYNGAVTIAEKCALAQSYGGIMIWELAQDAAGEYSLLAVIKNAMLSSEVAGDVNDDGICSAADAVMMQRFLLGDGTLTDPSAGDLSCDGIITAADLTLLKRMLLQSE